MQIWDSANASYRKDRVEYFLLQLPTRIADLVRPEVQQTLDDLSKIVDKAVLTVE